MLFVKVHVPPRTARSMEGPTRGLVAKASIVIRSMPEEVWHALTNPETIGRYMFGATVVSDMTVGSPIVWKGEWQGRAFVDKGVILALEPQRLIRYSHFSPLSGLPDVPENYHTVSVHLERERQGVRVTLIQDNNESEEARAHSEGGWTLMLGRLKAILEG